MDHLPPNHVLIFPTYCGVCGSDLHEGTGKKVVRGHEMSGVVAKVGPEVRAWRPGDRVVVEPLVSCNSCPSCLEGRRQLCPALSIIGVHQDGGFSRTLTVPDYALLRVPDSISDRSAALVEPVAVAVHAIRRSGLFSTPQRGQVLIAGLGSVGLMLVAVSAFLGLRSVSVVGRHAFQVEAAKQIANHFNMDLTAFDSVASASLEVKADIVFEAIGGRSSVLNDIILSIRPGGRIVCLGVFEPGKVQIDPFELLVKSITLVASNCYDHAEEPSDFEMALRVVEAEGGFLEKVFVSHVVPLEELSEAIYLSSHKETSQAIKVLVKTSDPNKN